MARLELVLRVVGPEGYVQFLVDGDDLGARIMESLGDDGYDDCLPWSGVDYDVGDTVLGEKARLQGAESAFLLACGCGCFACSGVTAHVEVAEDRVTWRDFRTHTDCRAPIEPITFDRAQFDEAVRQLLEAASRLP